MGVGVDVSVGVVAVIPQAEAATNNKMTMTKAQTTRATGYEYFCIGPSANTPEDLCPGEVRTTGGTSATVSGLNTAAIYNFLVWAVNAVGVGEWAGPSPQATIGPEAKGSVIVSPTSLTVSEGGSATYRVQMSSNPSQPVQVSSTGLGTRTCWEPCRATWGMILLAGLAEGGALGYRGEGTGGPGRVDGGGTVRTGGHVPRAPRWSMPNRAGYDGPGPGVGDPCGGEGLLGPADGPRCTVGGNSGREPFTRKSPCTAGPRMSGFRASAEWTSHIQAGRPQDHQEEAGVSPRLSSTS